MDMIKSANLALRFLLEVCALVAFAYWGFTTGSNTIVKIVLGIGAPLLVAVIWGAFIAPKARVPLPGAITFILGLAILLLAGLALAATSDTTLAITFVVVTVVNAMLLAIWKQ